ncbi:MAG TPA: Ig-like domain-containing protein [Tepidisphaeraceae bacterium]|jgi:hypothetical protein
MPTVNPSFETLESRQLLAADLIGTSFDVTGGQPLPAGDLSATFTIKNQNGIWFLDDAGPFQATVFLSQDATIGDAGDIPLGTAIYQSLGAGQSVTRTLNISVPATDPFLSSNDYRIGVVIDSAGQVAESNESNNSNQGFGKDTERVWFENHVLNPANIIPKCQNLVLGAPVSGAIGGTDERMGGLDIDSWQFTPVGGQTIAFDLDCTSPGWNSTIRLIQLNNGQYTSDTGTAAPGEPTGTGDSLIRWTFPYNIPVFIAVSGAGNSSGDPCYLTGRTAASQGSYTLQAFVVPNAPSAPDLDDLSDSGPSYTDNITKASSLKFNINGQAGKIAQLYVDGVIRGTDPNGNANGQYQITVSGLSDGAHTITSALLDPGNGYTSNLSAPLTVKIDTSVPPAPAPDLASSSDSGLSNSDNITNDTTPTFAGTTEPNASVRLLRNGSLVLMGDASSTGAWSLTPTISGDGSSSFTIVVIDQAGNISTSAALSITLDTAGPILTTPLTFGFDTSPHRVSMAFSDDVAATLSASDLTVINLATSSTIGVGFTYGQQHATYTFTGFSVLPQGNYRATLNSAGVTDVAGNGVQGNTVIDFFVLPADANHDRSVDVNDMNILASNWHGTGKTFTQGDFNYDGTVDASDLAILSTQWRFTLPAAPASSTPGTSDAEPTQTGRVPKSNFATGDPIRPSRVLASQCVDPIRSPEDLTVLIGDSPSVSIL